ncbi:30S ribosomal protein S27ae [Candidatus Woesearchaeota archaeon]|nr:30S ribosomal protein S27ae [Candidatus Woesearchaeota archaeon]
MAGDKDKKPKAAAPKAKGKSSKVSNVYQVSGGSITRKNKTCPKCGPGVFMGDHKDRWACGKCKYTEKK